MRKGANMKEKKYVYVGDGGAQSRSGMGDPSLGHSNFMRGHILCARCFM